jgi:uncharacterized repeat protein (TIGR03803 family)
MGLRRTLMEPRKLWRDVSPLGLAMVACLALATGAWAGTEKVLYTFTGGADGGNPYAGVVFDNAGNLYSTTFAGGTSGGCAGYGCGTVFELTPGSGGAWTETVLYSFTGGVDGGSPASDLIFDSVGNLYGTTDFYGSGGACNDPTYGCGTAFELSPTSNGWAESVIYDFTDNDGGFNPAAGVIFDKNGNLYGTAGSGGAHVRGTVYELVARNNGWSEKTLYAFGGSSGGAEPADALIFDAAGNLYGTAYAGGTYDGGTVFELTSGSREAKTLHVFQCGFGGCSKKDKGDGANPLAGLVMDSAGNLYGTTRFGGNYKHGTVFKVARLAGGKWKETIIHSFTGGDDGEYPYGGLTIDRAGKLYGTTSGGGTHVWGTVFELKPSRSGRWKESVLYDFSGGSDGGEPLADLVIDASGNLYGTAALGGDAGCAGYGCGVVFEIIP